MSDFETNVQTTLDPPPFKLDWDDEYKVGLKNGKFVHFLNRAGKELQIERDKRIPSETPIGKDGSYQIASGADVQDEIDAEYYDQLKAREPEGYNGKPVPKAHKASAFRGMFRHTVYLPDNADVFDDVIEIHELIGDPDNPAALIKHFFNQPDEKLLSKMKNAGNARMAPDKRGRQKIVVDSTLIKSMAFYAANLNRIENATVNGEAFTPEKKAEFINFIEPLIQDQIVAVLVREITDLQLD